jgi:hypothetical protein
MLRVANGLLHATHVALILFTLFGWLVPPLRGAHLIVCGLTLASWFAIGLVIGKPGFCLVTEMQFRVRRRLGIQRERASYIAFLLEAITGRAPDPRRTEVGTQAAMYVITAVSALLFFGP